MSSPLSLIDFRAFVALSLLALGACESASEQRSTFSQPDAPQIEQALASDSILTAGVVALEGVYNTELVAPYDVLEHTAHHDSTRFVAPFLVSPDGESIVTSEGVEVAPHYSFDDAPPIDVLVVPSTHNSLGADLENEQFLDWLGETARSAEYVITVCNGAFPLATTGVLDGRQATTYPTTQDQLEREFSEVAVQSDTRFVVDGKYITSVGGMRSYEPALYLVDHLYGPDVAQGIAEGLVLSWTPDEIPHVIAQ